MSRSGCYKKRLSSIMDAKLLAMTPIICDAKHPFVTNGARLPPQNTELKVYGISYVITIFMTA